MAATSSLIPKNVLDEFRKQLQGSRGYDAKQASARRFVYLTMVGKNGAAWWNENREKLLIEMDVVESQRTPRGVQAGGRPV